ncbi:MAG: 3'-5' exonuclease [Acidobacteriota bacterium]
MAALQLTRPIVCFDLETTGIDPASDRIVEISILRLEPDGTRLTRTRRINPGRPIPEEATAVHGIRDEDVADAPSFRQVAKGLLELLEGADLTGFNVARFDIPLLDREFRDCKLNLGLDQRRIVDAMTIFHRMEPRDLSAATRFYLGREHAGAHTAEADVAVSFEILEAQLARYDELPDTVDALDAWLRRVPENAADQSGKFVHEDGRVVFNFGKHKGKPLAEVAVAAPDYLKWILGSDFPDDAKQVVRDAVDGQAAS